MPVRVLILLFSTTAVSVVVDCSQSGVAYSHDALDLGLPSGVTAADGTWASNFGTPAAMQVHGVSPVVWEVPDTTYTFTPTDGGSATTLTGTDYVTLSNGGFNDEFATTGGALYEMKAVTTGPRTGPTHISTHANRFVSV